MLHVQLMDRVLKEQEGQDLDKLLDDPKEWLAPLRAKINGDPKLAALLRLPVLSQAMGLAFKPEHLPIEVDIEVPWYFCDRISAPCPCVAAFDYGYRLDVGFGRIDYDRYIGYI